MKLITREGKLELYEGSMSDSSKVFDVRLGNVNFSCTDEQAAYRVMASLNTVINSKDIVDIGYDE